MDARYHFVTTYRLTGKATRVWDVLRDVEGWARWWPGLESVRLIRAPNGREGVGAVHRYVVRAPVGYRFAYETEVTAIEPMRYVDAVARGELAGRGRVAMEPPAGEDVTVWIAWLVETPKRWMRVLSPIARPAFAWNHHRLMNGFGTGLASASGMLLVSTEHAELSPRQPGFWVMPEPAR
ncbi:SRPBCC family protein [Microbacterium rhizosphaerae]|uniref:SRPBCC family protein n=1 Tax=Microbacterium rhizosphaerae TaxID=1678237 RepID=A0ABZ0SM88_9MICO|nr:SRPBCC family protein [Microbacterium rhizosphaerae]WPR90099.1 SRPBCC family protein [Microbacterium rhizosphaerae]